jgi:hypothetical protein
LLEIKELRLADLSLFTSSIFACSSASTSLRSPSPGLACPTATLRELASPGAYAFDDHKVEPRRNLDRTGPSVRLPSRWAIVQGLTVADRLQHAPGQQFAPAKPEWCQAM